MSTMIHVPASGGTTDNNNRPRARSSEGSAVYQNWGTYVEAPDGTNPDRPDARDLEIQYVRATNKRDFGVYVYSRWLDKSNNDTPFVLEGPVYIAKGDYYDFAKGLALLPGDRFQMRTDQHDSCDTTAVWDEFTD